jgi:hypothetical protein
MRHGPGAGKLLCLLPGAISFAAFSVYPLAIGRTDLVIALEQKLGPSWVASPIADNADAVLLICGIVMSSICWFYAERSERNAARRGEHPS